ncbi:MAG: NUDIX hydrolase [Prevotellaceae bacterium]|jgi:ADP-ribose pyrophosphatase YjhB (NUDIX family)|nr:NUDIX hydrolase [Prevotellaceae bacterium]
MTNSNLTYDNQGISVDCVVFGFDGSTLRVLLSHRWREGEGVKSFDCKLPGSLIADNEDLPGAAHRVIHDLMGARPVRLYAIDSFSDPQRVPKTDLRWINSYYHVALARVLTVVYFALVKLDSRLMAHTTRKGGEWAIVSDVEKLALDHNQILIAGFDHLAQQLRHEPVAFDLLPNEFTIRQLRNLYEVVLDIEMDSRNFRKKILSLSYIIPLKKRESFVSHKPAKFFAFDEKLYKRSIERKITFLS